MLYHAATCVTKKTCAPFSHTQTGITQTCVSVTLMHQSRPTCEYVATWKGLQDGDMQPIQIGCRAQFKLQLLAILFIAWLVCSIQGSFVAPRGSASWAEIERYMCSQHGFGQMGALPVCVHGFQFKRSKKNESNVFTFVFEVDACSPHAGGSGMAPHAGTNERKTWFVGHLSKTLLERHKQLNSTSDDFTYLCKTMGC